jgi:DNA-binding NarL/FixJ family response regulator
MVDLLEPHPDLAVGDEPPDVLVLATHDAGAETTARLRALPVATPVVLVTGPVAGDELAALVEHDVVAVLHRREITAERLAACVLAAAAGHGWLPPHLVGALLKHVKQVRSEVLAPLGVNPLGLTTREVEVLRLIADGLDTAEIAARLCYSERTVKNVLYALTDRLKLRNRAHAVACAVRAGVI